MVVTADGLHRVVVWYPEFFRQIVQDVSLALFTAVHSCKVGFLFVQQSPLLATFAIDFLFQGTHKPIIPKFCHMIKILLP